MTIEYEMSQQMADEIAVVPRARRIAMIAGEIASALTMNQLRTAKRGTLTQQAELIESRYVWDYFNRDRHDYRERVDNSKPLYNATALSAAVRIAVKRVVNSALSRV